MNLVDILQGELGMFFGSQGDLGGFYEEDDEQGGEVDDFWKKVVVWWFLGLCIVFNYYFKFEFFVFLFDFIWGFGCCNVLNIEVVI